MRRILLLLVAALVTGCGSTSPSRSPTPTQTPPTRPLPDATVHPPPLDEPAMAYDAATRTVVMFGGSQALPTDMTWSWDGKSWTQLHPAHSPPARQGAGMAYDPSHQVLILFGGVSYAIGDEAKPRGAGGTDQSIVDGDTWTWNGRDWKEVGAALPANNLRPDPALAWDASDNAVIRDDVCSNTCYFGGGRTWMWDWTSTSWKQANTPGAIPWNEAGQYDDTPVALGSQTPSFDPGGYPGVSRAVAADPATGGLLFVARGQNPAFDGHEAPGHVDYTQVETWAWNHGAWQALRPPMFPTGNSLPSPTLAPTGVAGEELLFDGWGETWLWNGSTWARATGVNPGIRGGAAMAFDEATGQVVLFGGEAAGQGGLLADTWIWKTGAWNRTAGSSDSFAVPTLATQPDPPAALGVANCKAMQDMQVEIATPTTSTTTIHILTRTRDLVNAGMGDDFRGRTAAVTQPGRLVCLVVVRCANDVPCMTFFGGGLGYICHGPCPSPTPPVPTIAYTLSEGDPLTNMGAGGSGGGRRTTIATILGLPNLLDS